MDLRFWKWGRSRSTPKNGVGPHLALPAPTTMEVGRTDGWVSTLAGLGTKRDRRTTFKHQKLAFTSEEIEILWRSNDLAARIIETLPRESLRQGFALNLEDKEVAELMMDRLEDLQTMSRFQRAGEYERGYGGAAIFPVINDLQADLSMPLNERRITSVQHLHVFEPRELHPETYYESLEDEKFGMPRTYRLNPRTRSRGFVITNQQIHESRLIVFPGTMVSRSQIQNPSDWGDSIMCRVFEVLRDFGISWDCTATLLHEFSQASIRLKGMAEMVALRGRSKLIKRLEGIELARSTINAVLLDENEEYERKQTPVTGLAELLDRFATRLAAAADMPVTLLMGQSPSGLNATGESDIRFFYDRVAAHRELKMKPQLERLIKLLFLSLDGPTRGNEPDRWSVDFNPLWQPSEKEMAETRKIVSEMDINYVNGGVFSPEEIAVSRAGGNKFSMEIVLAREIDGSEIEPLDAEVGDLREPTEDAPAEEPEADPTLDANQIKSLTEILIKVNTKALTREQGASILVMGFGLTEDQAMKVIGEEEAEPPPQPVPPTLQPPTPPGRENEEGEEQEGDDEDLEGEDEGDEEDSDDDTEDEEEETSDDREDSMGRKQRIDTLIQSDGRWFLRDIEGNFIISSHETKEAALASLRRILEEADAERLAELESMLLPNEAEVRGMILDIAASLKAETDEIVESVDKSVVQGARGDGGGDDEKDREGGGGDEDEDREEGGGDEDEDRRDVVEKRGNEWVVLSADRSRVLGRHSTEEAANRQLAAIELNKKRSE